MKKYQLPAIALTCSFALLGCNLSGGGSSNKAKPNASTDLQVNPKPPTDTQPPVVAKPPVATEPTNPTPPAPVVKPELPKGRFFSGDLHTHTAISEDAHNPVDRVLARAFDEHQLDFVFLSDHLRITGRDDQDNPVAKKPVSVAIEQYQRPYLAKYLDQGKVIISGTEWDNSTYEHTNIWMYTDTPNSDDSLALLRQFEFYAQDYDESVFSPEEVQKWLSERERFNADDDGLEALKWLQQVIPQGQGLIQLNHPNRKGDTYTISDYRDMLNAAPSMLCAFEGLPGNQATDLRAEYEYDRFNGNRRAFVYGGVDYSVNQVGGEWDTLLAEGYNVYVTSNSDFHDAYAPGQYNKNLVWLNEGQSFNQKNLFSAICSGKVVAMYGDLIDDLTFDAESSLDRKMMGDTLKAKAGDNITINIRFKPSSGNWYTQTNNLAPPIVDHIDLIAGDMMPKAQPNTVEYEQSTNPSTRVYQRFFADDWVIDDQGYYSMSFNLTAVERDMYFRIRGTNLAISGSKMDAEGVPHVDFIRPSGKANADNYSSLWFYSSPIYLVIQ
ncbi:hypothetical protein [Marinagarivorans algicola]|uniref:hypothetical protein n=1 Tax=Marinagarivorans algicola TaxID=1513270 RepID=UPI003736AB2C